MAIEDKSNQRLELIVQLPRKMLSIQGVDNIAEFVLHELCHEKGFNLKRAAYFVDNPDFDCCRGVVGHIADQAYQPKKDIWSEQESFTAHKNNTAFNQKVRAFSYPSFRRKGCDDATIVDTIARTIGMTKPSSYLWSIKHNNHGILVYEKMDPTPCNCTHLYECVGLLGFCPTF